MRVQCCLPLSLALAVLAAPAAMASKLPDGFRLEPVVGGLTEPSALAAAPDGRLLIAERTTGDLREIRGGELAVSPACHVDVETAGEAGLLGVAVHPGFARSGWIYLYYTDLASGRNKVTRFTLTATGCTEPLDVLSDLGAGPSFLRNGGGLAFGTDGKLFVATGDMEAQSNGQLDGVLQGKILRVEDDGSVPDDNPTPGSAVFAKGVRDGRTLAVGATGPLYAIDRGEVADASADELNPVPAGGNLGWDDFTGDSGGIQDDPLAWWSPAIGLRGLEVYGASAFPDLAADGLDNDGDRYGADLLAGVARVDDNGKGICVGSDNDGNLCTLSAECPSRPNELAYCYQQDEPLEHCFNDVPFGDDLCGGDGTDEPDESYLANLFFVGDDDDSVRRAVLDPGDPTTLHADSTFLDPSAWGDCPSGWTAVATGNDGWLYLTADNGGGAAGALYRITYDAGPGPREVSGPGGHFPLRVDKGAGEQVVISWEDLRKDSMQPRDDTLQPKAPAREFTIWRGDLGSFDSHAPVPAFGATAGSAVNDALRRATIDAPGDSYFLVSGRGDNLEGTLGYATGGAERTGYDQTDLCSSIGYYTPALGNLWGCGQDFTLADQNGDAVNLSDFRGRPVVLDLSAIWCGPCNSEANVIETLYQAYQRRGVVVLTALMDDFVDSGSSPPGRPTPGDCRYWGDRAAPNLDHTFPCLADPDAAVAWPRYGTGFLPTNAVLDSGMRVVYIDGGYSEITIRDKLNRMLVTSNSCLD